tara:strand:+ start:1404 stop:1886 length:483 start_codon:yes stop_codon:yes gene_type:complete
MEVKIISLPKKDLVGKRILMSLSNDRTVELWKNFMPYLKTIKNRTSPDVLSLQDYKSSFNHQDFTPGTKFDKWAAVEVSEVVDVPENMEIFTLSGGLYAVFLYTGTPSAFHKILDYIYNEWFPKSEYVLDLRPHFEILGDKYKNNDPNSEEEVWIPIKKK